MISAAEIKKKADKSYASFLSSLVSEDNFFPLVIRGNKSPSKTLEVYRKAMDNLLKASKNKNNKYSFTIDFALTKTKFIGTQSLPKRIYFDNEDDFIGYLKKTKEVQNFKTAKDSTLSQFPNLKSWLSNNPLKVVANLEHWGDILKVLTYFRANSKPNLYIRELPIKVHTKFIEKNKSVLRELLDIINIDTLNVDESKHFETRFHLKFSEKLVRFRLLDEQIAQNHFSGLSDITITISDFSRLKLPIKRVVIVENLLNLLTFPKMQDTLSIFGKGFNVLSLNNIEWLNDCEIYYWGDLDAQGFEILSGFRGYYPQTKSLMMNKTTFDKFYEGDLETKSKTASLSNLNDEEHKMHQLLFENKYRLEQEKISMNYTHIQLKKLIKQP